MENERKKRNKKALRSKFDKMVKFSKPNGELYCTSIVKWAKIVAKNILSNLKAVRIGVMTVDGDKTINSNGVDNTVAIKCTKKRE